MQEIVQGKILEIHDDGGVVIGAVLPSLERAVVRKYATVEVGFCDGRVISSDQRKKIYALLNEISMWVGDSPEEVKEMMKWDFVYAYYLAALKLKILLSQWIFVCEGNST